MAGQTPDRTSQGSFGSENAAAIERHTHTLNLLHMEVRRTVENNRLRRHVVFGELFFYCHHHINKEENITITSLLLNATAKWWVSTKPQGSSSFVPSLSLSLSLLSQSLSLSLNFCFHGNGRSPTHPRGTTVPIILPLVQINLRQD